MFIGDVICLYTLLRIFMIKKSYYMYFSSFCKVCFTYLLKPSFTFPYSF